MQCPFVLCFVVYTPTQYALSCKIPKFKFYAIRKKSKQYLGAPKLKENGSEYSVLENIYNALFYSFVEYIHQLSMLSHVKYRDSNFTRIEKIEILSRHTSVKNKISLNIICQKKIYNAPFYSVLEYIHQLSMLSHVK